MNNKLKSFLSILAIACAVAVPILSANAHELPVQATLSAPASWTFKYTNEDFPGYKIRSTTAVISTPSYTRTADGVYFDYTNTSTITTGLTVQQTFNRSNTSWYNNAGIYIPSATKIGSDATVGFTTDKIYLKFDNQTNKDYLFYLDISSNGNLSRIYNLSLNNVSTYIHSPQTTSLLSFLIPSYTNLQFIQNGSLSVSQYFDAWYLQDLGLSASYDAGYDTGYDDAQDVIEAPNTLINAFESIIGMFVNFTFILFSLEMFGVSILTIVGVLFGIVAIVWILKTIRG
jgi:hypothetical protein